MKLDQFGMSGLGTLFKQLHQASPGGQAMPTVGSIGGGENIAVGLGGGSLTPSLPTGSGSGATSSGSGIGATASPTTAKPIASLGMEDAQMKSYSPAMPFPGFPGLPNPYPKPSVNPLSGLEFFLQNLAMQDQASASQDKIKGLMSGIQTLISNEFTNANFEGGGDSSINRLTTIMGKY